MIVSILPVSLFRRNNLKSYPNIFSPNREINYSNFLIIKIEITQCQYHTQAGACA